MKRHYPISVSGLLLSSCLVFSQPAKPPPGAVPSAAPRAREDPAGALTSFDLDFPGGTPEQLVRAMEKASGKPVNVVIPEESSEVQVPALKMKGVTVPQLFEALGQASQNTGKSFVVPLADGRIQTYFASYAFRSVGPPSENAVWFFSYNKPSVPQTPKACRFYQLAPYLETYKVEDITTAIQTGWKMLGETNPPTISYHKDTRMLIAVGESDKLRLIENVLEQLSNEAPKAGAKSARPKSPETAKPAADK